MKPKQKHKRGADRYSLDIYTPLTRDECIDRLREGKKDYPLIRFSVRDQGTEIIIWLYPKGLTPFHFEGRFEPYVAGTRVYGKICRTFRFHNSDTVWPIYVMGVLVLGIFIGGAFLNDFNVGLRLVGCTLVGGITIVPIWILNWMIDHFRRGYNPQLEERLLHWIEEQLTVEAAHETKTKA
jgi:hypothetical protein